MGADDAVCESSPTGVHELQLAEVVVNGPGRGAATVEACRWCSTTAYDASATDR